MIDAVSQFRDSMLNAGVTPPEEIIPDGNIHRYPTSGKNTDRAGAYIFYPDSIPAGFFCDWRTGIKETWRADVGRNLTPQEEKDFQKTAKKLKEARAKEKADRQKQAEKRAKKVVEECQPCEDHPYLTEKKIYSHGALFLEDKLVIPIYVNGSITSLQTIDKKGEKRFLPGGRIQGGYYPIGKIEDSGTLCVVEGFATGASINEATGYPVAVAFNTSGLMPVAKAMREKFPAMRILFCADDDHKTEGNPGITKAKEAAAAVDGEVVIPHFGPDRPEKATDFNDLAVLQGLEAVKEQVLNPVTDSFHGLHASNSTHSDSENEWPEPSPIGTELEPVKQITENMIPEPFSPWISDAADRMQIPPDYLINPLMVVCGSLVGTSCGMRPKQKDDWTVIPNMWGGIIGPPSMLKSPALSEVVNKTLGRLEATAREEHEEAAAQHGADMMVAAAKKDAIQAEIKKAVKTSRQGKEVEDMIATLTAEFAELQGLEAPTERRYKTNDSSIEKIVELLNENPRGLLYFRDELIGLFKRTEKAGNEQDRAFLLESWNGDGSHTDDRIGRGTVRTDKLCLSLLGGIQPDKLISYLNGALNNGDNDGFVQRLQLLVYPDPIKNWEYKDRWPDADAKNKAFTVIENLSAIDAGGEEGFLRFDAEGQEVFKKWLTWLETEKLVNTDDHPVILQHLAKYRSLMPSLALLFHLIDIAAGKSTAQNVSRQAALMAAAWCQYLESHARRIYNLALNNDQVAATRLIEKIKAGKLKSEFKRHEIVSKKWGMLTKREQAQSAIDCLIDNGWLREKRHSAGERSGGRPAASTYRVNPKIFS